MTAQYLDIKQSNTRTMHVVKHEEGEQQQRKQFEEMRHYGFLGLVKRLVYSSLHNIILAEGLLVTFSHRTL